MYEGSKVIKSIKIENRIFVVSRSWKEGRLGRRLMDVEFLFCKMQSSGGWLFAT